MPDTRTPIGGTTFRSATLADADRLVPLLCASFFDDAVATWIFTDPARRREILPHFFGAFYRLSVESGGAYTTEDRDLVLLSMPPDAAEPPAGFEDGLGAIAGEYAEALLTVTALQEAHRPQRRHHYFTFGCITPGRRGSGLAAEFAHALRLCDGAGVPAYAEASSPQGRAIATRFGFAPIGTEITLPNGGPTLRPMWREPHELS